MLGCWTMVHCLHCIPCSICSLSKGLQSGIAAHLSLLLCRCASTGAGAGIACIKTNAFIVILLMRCQKSQSWAISGWHGSYCWHDVRCHCSGLSCCYPGPHTTSHSVWSQQLDMAKTDVTFAFWIYSNHNATTNQALRISNRGVGKRNLVRNAFRAGVFRRQVVRQASKTFLYVLTV